ncbi:MAG: undecaprenyl-phosphate glucose phosphotransferase [Bacteroides sp.]|nr:undecaprenyl-phosphate glucose phosphotransferase [Roseburia sp.]MCM1345490.1 undecaprenyl-phosphate glucose phosphotransferase [Bacteroides sp.]MCM1419999.1 undecaprenyl-phosphate glucose phosphotransferase [Bacteroides sp.]
MGKDKVLYLGILLTDLCLLVASATIFYYVCQYVNPEVVAGMALKSTLTILVFSFLVIFSIYPPVAQERFIKTEDIVKRVLFTSILFLLVTSLGLTFILPNTEYPRSFLFSYIAIFAVLLLIERLCVKNYFISLRSNNNNIKHIVLVGNTASIHNLYQLFRNPMFGYNIKGIFFNENSTFEELNANKTGTIAELYSWLRQHPETNEIYAFLPKNEQDQINMLSKFCDNNLIRFYYVPAIDVFQRNMTVRFINNTPVIARREEPLTNPYNKFMKRAFDFIVSSLFLICIYPFIFVFVAIMIKIKSPGPIYFKQKRTGMDGKIFNCIKFRSMKVNADSDKVQATKDDPRKYPFGNFMRKTNIDELPQFINVWKGDMSLVGPRPHMLKHTEEYSRLINRFMVRHLAKPGITGLAQVSGFRGETKYIDQMEGRVLKDIEYIENWTFLLDLKIMVKTVTNMFEGEKNAY